MSFRSVGRDANLIALAKSVGWLGDEMATIALMLRLQSGGSGAGAVAALLTANAAPIVLMSGVAGRIVDRFDSRALLVTTGTAQCATCVVLAEVHSPGATLVLVALLGAGQSVNGTTWQALLAASVPPERLARAVGRAQAGMTLAGVLAPALSGVLVGLCSARVPLLVDAATFAAIALIALVIATRRRVMRVAGAARLRGGIAIVRADALLRPLLVLLAVFVLLGSMVNVADVFLVRDTLSASTTWYGIVAALYSVGAVAGAVFAGRLRSVVTQARGLVVAILGLSVGLAVIGLVPSVEWMVPLMLVTGSANGAMSVTLSSLVLGATSADERGRVGALRNGVASGMQIVAFAASGALASVTSPRAIFVVAGVLGAAAPVLLGRPVLRAAATSGIAPPALDSSPCLPADGAMSRD